MGWIDLVMLFRDPRAVAIFFLWEPRLKICVRVGGSFFESGRWPLGIMKAMVMV